MIDRIETNVFYNLRHNLGSKFSNVVRDDVNTYVSNIIRISGSNIVWNNINKNILIDSRKNT